MMELRFDGDLSQSMTRVKWWAEDGHEMSLREMDKKGFNRRQLNNIWKMAEWSKSEFMRLSVKAGAIDFVDAQIEYWLWNQHKAHPHKSAVTNLALSLIAREIWRLWNED